MPVRSKLRLVSGLPSEAPLPERIAFSLVHPLKRIDIPSRDVVGVEARSEITFSVNQRPWTLQAPHVEIILKSNICAKLHALTQRIIDDPLEIWIQGKLVSSPIVREPLGLQSQFNITAFDLAEAQALAERIWAGWIAKRPMVVK